MSLKTFVKVSKVNNLSDARYCAGMGVDIIGFNLSPGAKDFVPADKFKQITEWLSGVDFAGEFEGLTAADIIDLSQNYPIQYLQISDPSLLKELSNQSIPLIFKIDMEETKDFAEIEPLLQQHHHQVAFFLFESEKEAFEENLQDNILALAADYHILLGYGITPSNAIQLIDQTPIKGISLLGEEEIRAGYKDFDKLAEILELLEEDEFEN